MSLTSGTRLGPYEILSALGAGGMGEVYRARDPRLGRDVAIKILPPLVSADPERLRRFEQEARAAAALSHPNILHILDVGVGGGTSYLVSELLEGETLRAAIARGPLSITKASDYARQLALGLAAAHARGITHRDIKPDNLFITSDGILKILDFGLAKLRETSGSDRATTLEIGTSAGVVLGTARYMSPEQIRAQAVDARSDIFSAGIVLYEMVAGAHPFVGDSGVEAMNAILNVDAPDLTARAGQVPPGLARIVHHCLEKSPADRFQSARDLAFALEALSGSRPSPASDARTVGTSGSSGALPRWLPWLIAGVASAGCVAAFALPGSRLQHPPESPVFRFPITIGDNTLPRVNFGMNSLAVSPDGRTVAFVTISHGRTALWVRSLGAMAAVPVPGTEGAYSPFWSPDSRTIGFFAGGKLNRIEPSGASLQTICTLSREVESVATWGPDDSIMYMDFDKERPRIYRVAAVDGHPAPLATPASFRFETWLTMLPDGRHYLAHGRLGEDLATEGTYLGTLDGDALTLLLPHVNSRVAYADGYLLYAREGSLLAHAFDLAELRVSGAPVTVAERLAFFDQTGWSEFSVSETGVLAYMVELPPSHLGWVNRRGHDLGEVTTAGIYEDARLSPDGKKLALGIDDRRTMSGDLWILDIAAGTSARVTSGPGAEASPVWAPDGRRMAYFSCCENNLRATAASTLIIKEVTDLGGAGTRPLPPGFHSPDDWSADGRFILYDQWTLDFASSEIWALPLEGDRKPFRFRPSPFRQGDARFSPDGRWVAFASAETGHNEVYVAPFDRPTAEQLQISKAGGRHPVWRGDGKELFYVAADSRLIAVPITTGATASVGAPVALFGNESLGVSPFDVSRDGERFVLASATAEIQRPFTVVVNWPATLKR